MKNEINELRKLTERYINNFQEYDKCIESNDECINDALSIECYKRIGNDYPEYYFSILLTYGGPNIILDLYSKDKVAIITSSWWGKELTININNLYEKIYDYYSLYFYEE